MIGRFARTVYKELRLKRWTIAIYLATVLLFLLMYSAVYPAVQDQAQKFTEMFSSYPKAFLDAFGITQLDMSTFANYLAMEHYSLIWPLMVAMLMVSLSGAAISGEIEKRTMSIMLSLPMSRLNIYAAKYTAGVVALVVFSFISVMVAVPLAWMFNFSVDVGAFWSTLVISLAFGWAILGLGYCASSFFGEKGRAYLVIGGGLLLMYVVNVISQLVDSLDWIRYLSVFNYYKPADILGGAALDGWAALVLCAVAMVASIVGALRFKRRDIIT